MSKHAKAARKIWPRQKDGVGGWIIDYEFLSALCDAQYESAWPTGMEEVESLLLALESNPDALAAMRKARRAK